VSGRFWTFGWSGLAFGLSFLCKQPGLLFGLFALVILLRDEVAAPAPEKGKWLGRLAVFCAGWALPFLLTCLVMAWAGTFGRFWFWTIDYARVHAGLLGWEEGRAHLIDFKHKAGTECWSLVVAALGLVCLLRDPQRRQARFVLGWWLAFSLIAFTASFYFARHYFILMLPVVCLLTAVAVRRAAQALGEPIAAGGFALVCTAFIFVNRAVWFEQTPEAASRTLHGRDPFPEAPVIAQYVQEHSAPNDSIAIMGSEPEIYFLAHRHSASGYLYMYDLMQTHRYALPMQQEAIQQIEAAKPAFMLVVYVDSSWTLSHDSEMTIVHWYKTYWDKYYEMAGMVWLLPDRTEYIWGPEASTREFQASFRIRILRRKPGV